MKSRHVFSRAAIRLAVFSVCGICLAASAQTENTVAPPVAPLSTANETPAATDANVFDLRGALREGKRSLSADDVAVAASKSAPKVASIEAQAESARHAAELANIAVYPRVDLEARYTRLSDSGSVEIVPGFAMPATVPDQWGLKATVTYPVSQVFLSVRPRYEAALKGEAAQRLSAQVETQRVKLAAREAFFNYARAKATLVVARLALAQTEAQRRDVDAQVQAGTLARAELLRADSQLASSKVAIARAEGAVATGANVLGMLMHDPSVADVAVLDEIEAPLPPPTETKEALIEQAKQKRYEIQVLRTMISANELSLDAYSADQLPKFLVGGSAELANPNQRYSSFEHEWNGSWALFAALAWSPNDYLAASKSQGQVRASLAQSQADIAVLEDAIRIEVSQAFEDYKAAQAALEASNAAIAFAEENYRVRRAQFQAGAAVARDVIDAEVAQRQARLELVNAAIDVRIASVRLDRSLER